MARAWVVGISLLGFALFLATGLFGLGRFPGFHFDEAWAAEYAYRIFFERGFWPIEAMSPYTHPWAHYLTAVFFRLFGVDLFVYRAAGVAMCSVGAGLAWIALLREGEKKAAMIFPFLLAVFVPFVANERFVVEITTFHVLCLGLLIFGVQRRSPLLIFIASFLGITSHILFLAPVTAMLAVWALQSGRWEKSRRIWVCAGAAALWPFLWKIHREIPEKDKSSLLLILDALVFVFFLARDQMPRSIRRLRVSLRWAAVVVALPFLAYLIFFSEGHWSLLFFTGQLARPWLVWITAPLTVVGVVFLVWNFRRENYTAYEQRFWTWILVTLILIGILAVKPAPRYFQMAFFLTAFGISVLLARVRIAAVFLVPFVGLSLAVLVLNYFQPGLTGQAAARSYRFLIFHDSSEDTTSKQALARTYGEKGCSYSQVAHSDPRVDLPLRFLSYGDWPITPGASCPAQF